MAVIHLSVDLTIVGAGPAGLFAAHRLLELRPNARIAVLDRGQDVATRVKNGRGSGSDDWLLGMGGAGFFIGGRMSLDINTLSGRPATLSIQEARPVATEIDALLTEWAPDAVLLTDPPPPLASAIARAKEAGLGWQANYPARHLSSTDRIGALNILQEAVTPSAQILTGSTVKEVETAGRSWRTRAVRNGVPVTVDSRTVLFAPGRGGAEWMASVLDVLGVRAHRMVSVGVRVETGSDILATLTDLTPDPRLNMSDESGTFRSYAFAVGGTVCEVARNGTARISCRPAPRDADSERTKNTSFAVLWQPNDIATQERLLQVIPQTGMAGLKEVGVTAADDTPSFVPTLDLPAAALESHWPAGYWKGFREFIRRLDSLAPGLANTSTRLYSPAIETVWTYETDASGDTSVPGVFVAGDGAGISQGAMAAAISGRVAGGAIALALDGTASGESEPSVPIRG